MIALLDCESNKEEAFHKRALSDIMIEDENHVKYIVEIDRNARSEFVQKACFNASSTIVDSLTMGESYLNIDRVIHISLLYFDDKANTNSPISFGQVHFLMVILMKRFNLKHLIKMASHVMHLMFS